MGSSVLRSASFTSTFKPVSGELSMIGITPLSIAIARRLIFWYLLTLQKSVMQTVRSANAPLRTMAEKCSLLTRVTSSNAELTIRSENGVEVDLRFRSNQRTSRDLRCGREDAEHCPPPRPHIAYTRLNHLLQALQNLQRISD